MKQCNTMKQCSVATCGDIHHRNQRRKPTQTRQDKIGRTAKAQPGMERQPNPGIQKYQPPTKPVCRTAKAQPGMQRQRNAG